MKYEIETINDLCKKITDGSHFSPEHEDSGEYQMYSVKDMEYNGFINSNCKLIGKEMFMKLLKSDCRPLKNDILIAKDGSYLKYAFKVKEDLNACILSSIAILRPNEKMINPDYFVYLMRSQSIKSAMANYVSGSALPRIILSDFKKMKLKIISDINVQQKIANILSHYDEAIENNNKRIKLLEQMAQNLYKEWFVRFRFPGWENCEFENGIPVGWKVEKLGNFCKITDGTHDTPAQVEEGIPLVTGKAIRNGRIDFSIPYNISVEDHEKIKKRSGLKTGDILFSNIGTIGNVCLVNYDREFSVKNMIIFKPESINQSMYLFYLLNSDSIQSLFTAQTNGASQQFLGLDFMRRFKILLPSEEIIKLFGEKEVLIIQQINIFQQQNQNLAKQRDLLLPRLMSGKLEV